MPTPSARRTDARSRSHRRAAGPATGRREAKQALSPGPTGYRAALGARGWGGGRTVAAFTLHLWKAARMSFWRYHVRRDGSFWRTASALSDDELAEVERLLPKTQPDQDARPAPSCSRCGGDLLLYWITPLHGPMSRGVILELCPACDAHRPAAQAYMQWSNDLHRDPKKLPKIFEAWEDETMSEHGWARILPPEAPPAALRRTRASCRAGTAEAVVGRRRHRPVTTSGERHDRVQPCIFRGNRLPSVAAVRAMRRHPAPVDMGPGRPPTGHRDQPVPAVRQNGPCRGRSAAPDRGRGRDSR